MGARTCTSPAGANDRDGTCDFIFESKIRLKQILNPKFQKQINNLSSR